MDALGAQALADGRLRLVRPLGEGGMGVVYEAFDRDSRRPVAVKMMRSRAPEALLRLKTEFRSLREVHHDNLVRLGELFVDGDTCFFTMELIDGGDVLDHVFAAGATRRRPRTAATVSGSRRAPQLEEEEDERTVWDADTLRLEVLFDEGKLRTALRQLALGLAALHRAGKVHRDVKPSNVLVDPDGRVVLLDFGLAADVGETIAAGTIEGTVEYMAPEQAAGHPAGPSADLYAVGVLLYEALTGRPPFTGDVLDVLQQKQHLEPMAPSLLFAGVPPDLDELALALLRKEPSRRPSAQEVADGLAASRRTWRPGGARVVAPEPPFVGRAEPLAALARALEDSAKRPVAVLIAGESGIGKSSLIRKFASDLRGSGAIILSGRCHAQESVPFRAFDGVADALTRYLVSLPPEERAAVLPPDTACLSRLFRVFERLAPGALDEDALSGVDVRARRRRAFAVLRELLDNLARRGRVALVIDDLQWIDSDSLQLMEALFSLRPPRLLLVAMMRPVKDRLAEVRGALAPLAIDVRELGLTPLSADEAARLAEALLPGRDPDAVARIADACHGSPLFVEQVAAAAAAGKPHAETLERVLWDKIDELSDDERRVLDLACVAGLGLDHATVARAGGVARQDYTNAVQRLAEQRLVQTTGSRRNDLIEPYHDQVRQAVRALMTPESARRRHAELAEALERRSAPPWLIFHHWLTAGQAAKAAPFAIEAAVGAQRELSARRVAHLCQVALGLLPEQHPSRRDLCRALAVALGNAGQGAEAAQWYLEAAREAQGVEALELRRLAADHLLRCGHFDDGMAVLREVLTAVDIELPATPRAALASLIWRRARLRVPAWRRGRPDDAVRLRTDVCLSVGTSLSMVDTILGANLHALGALEARRLGDPERTARALAIEAGYAATAGTVGAARTAQLLASAERAAEVASTPVTRGLVMWMRGIVAVLQGRYVEGFDLSDAASRNFAATCPGHVWEQASAEMFAAWALSHLGRLDELTRRLDDLEQVARWHDDRYTQTLARVGNGILPALAADDPARATEQVDAAIGQWSQGGFHLQHAGELMSRTEIALYTDDAAGAWRRLADAWPAVQASLLLRIQHTRMTQLDLRCRALIALDDRSQLGLVRDHARQILKDGPTWAAGLAHGRLAALAAADHRATEARAELTRGAELLESVHMDLHAAAFRLRLAWLDGADLPATPAWTVLAQRGVQKPDRWLAMYAPWPK